MRTKAILNCKTCGKQTREWFTVDGECWFCIAKQHDCELVVK